LPHVAVKQTEPDLSFHIISEFFSGCHRTLKCPATTGYAYKVSSIIADCN